MTNRPGYCALHDSTKCGCMDALVITCRLCGGDLGRQFGSHWDCRNDWRISLDTLGANLAMAAALCRSYEIGASGTMLLRVPEWATVEVVSHAPTWQPGCGRSAP